MIQNFGVTFERTDIWKEGMYVDLWSVVHVLSGVILGFLLVYAGFTILWATITAFVVMVLWEIFEWAVDIEEVFTNKIFDVVVGMLGFSVAVHLFPLVAHPSDLYLFGGIVVVTLVMSFFGWRESMKAAVLEKRLREEFRREKEAFKIQRERLAQKKVSLKKRIVEKRGRRGGN